MAFCTKQKEVHDLVEGSIVDQTGPSCNLLLVELSRISKIASQSAGRCVCLQRLPCCRFLVLSTILNEEAVWNTSRTNQSDR